jgi:Uma2 family endonuclease
MCEMIPEAVIEILSKGYKKKDTEISLPFYLTQGIRDIVIFDPSTNRVRHYHDGQTDEYNSPIPLTFACGCRATL